MNSNLVIIILTIVIFLVSAITIILVKIFIKNAEKTRKAELLIKNQEILLPLRLQAYERLTLMLERISPDSLLTRHNQAGLTSRQLQTILITSLRNEYEHNLSQQVYISQKAWEIVKNAKNQITVIINTSAQQTNSNAPSIELSKKILESAGEYEKLPTTIALEYLKKEIQSLF
jgi:hypothetical protein